MIKYFLYYIFIGLLFGRSSTDKLLLKNSNSYYGTYIQTVNKKVFFKIGSNIQIDSVAIGQIQLLKLSTGNKIIENGIKIGNESIEDLAIRNVRQISETSFKWKGLGSVSIPLSIVTGSIYWNLSKRLNSSNNGIFPAFMFGATSILGIPFILSKNNIRVIGAPLNIKSKDRKEYEKVYVEQIKRNRRKSILRGFLVGTIATTMYTYLFLNVKIN